MAKFKKHSSKAHTAKKIMAKDALPSVLCQVLDKKFTEYHFDTGQSKVAVTGRGAISVQFAECRPN